MSPSTSTTTPSRGEPSTQTIDITTPRPTSAPDAVAASDSLSDSLSDTSTPCSSSMPSHQHTHHYYHTSPFKRHYRSHPSFTSAYHRIVSRQQREFDRTNPNLIRELIDVAEERQENPIRQRTLLHVSRAYICVGYTHALLTILISLICAALLIAISRSVASDVARKTRDRATNLIASAADCAARVKQNHCIVDGDHVSHTSYEMATLCKQWVQCANRRQHAESDARSAKVWAETLADIANTFAERLSTTAIIISALLFIVLSILFSSSTLSFLHRRVADDSSSILASPSVPNHLHHHTASSNAPHLITHRPLHANNANTATTLPTNVGLRAQKQPTNRFIDYNTDTRSSSSRRS